MILGLGMVINLYLNLKDKDDGKPHGYLAMWPKKIIFDSNKIYVDFGYVFRKYGFFEGRYNFISEFIILIYGSPLYNTLYINKMFQSKKEIIINQII